MEQAEPSLDAMETSSNTVDNESPSADPSLLIDTTEGYEASERKFDIVAIHGLCGKQWSSSKSNTWLRDLAAYMNWEVRIIRYAYDAAKLAEAPYPEEAISSEASTLLQKLSELRRDQQPPLPLALFAHDLGGIIAKKALILASRYDSEHSDISYSTKLLMFFGCPHRTLDTRQDIEILASRLEMLKPADSIVTRLNRKCLARSIIGVNDSFLNTRVLTRANVINIISSKTDATERVFDKYTAALGVPMEKISLIDKSHKELIDEPEAYAPYGGFQTKRISSFPWQDDKLSRVMGTIMHQAPPMYPFKFNTTRGFVWISEHDTMIKWLKSWGLGLLHIHGTSAISNVAQHVYEGIVDRGKSSTFRAILYFKFDKHDIRRNSIGAMANSFLLQTLNCWTDKDAFFFLEKLMKDITTHGEIHWIIDGLDQCDDSSALFLSMVSDMAKNSEQHFKILVTTVDDSQIREALSEFPSIDLREHPPTAEVMQSIVLEFMTELCHARPQYRHVEQEIRQLLDSCSDDDLLRRLLLEWLLVAPCASTKSAVEREIASLTPLSPVKIFERCLNAVPEGSRPWARRVLMWMSLSFRPLTPEELGSALSLDTSTDPVPEQETYGDLMWDIESCFGPIITRENGHVQFRHPAVRDFLTTLSDASDQERPWYAWNSSEEGHRNITDACVGYLSLPSTQDKILTACQTCPVDQRIFESPSDITSYAVEFWPLHYQRGHSSAFPKPQHSSIASFFSDDTALKRWDAATWYLSNPHIRSDQLFLSPVIASIGDENSVETWIQSQEPDGRDIALALTEASRFGHSDVVKFLLQKSSTNADVCLEAIMVAARSAELETLRILLAHAIGILHITQWPGILTSRFAYLGLVEHLTSILQAGANANSSDPDFSPPLHCAIVRDETAAFDTLIEHGADPAAINSNWVDTPPIVVAGKYGRAKIIDGLAKAALIDAQDNKGRNALWYAGGRGHHAVFQALVKAGANTEALTAWVRDLRPALIPIAGLPYPKCLKSVLDAGVDINAKLREAHSFHALGIAARAGHVEICRMLLDHGTCKEFDDDSALIHATRANNIEIVNMLLKEGYKVDVQLDDSPYHGTPLVAAARAAYHDIVTVLLENGASVNYSAPRKITPLMSAVLASQATITKKFIDAGADMDVIGGATYNWSATHFAYNRLDCMKVLVDAGADINSIGPDGSPFYLAAYFNSTKVVELLLEHKPDLETRCPEGDFTDAGYTALHCAAYYGYNELLRLLLEAGADIEAKTLKDGTPLILAVATNNEESVKILLEYKLDIDAVDVFGGTAIFCLPNPANLSVVRRLINRGASLTLRNKEKYTPLGRAVVNGDLPLARMLSSEKIDLNAEAAENGTALHIATEECNIDMVKVLTEKGASPDIANSWMYGSPLQRLFEKYDTSTENKDVIARYLINDAGADVNVHGGNLGSVLNAAILSGSLDTIKFILEKGADIYWQDLQGRRPIHYAALKSAEHFRLLLEASGEDEERLGITTKTRYGMTVLHFAVATGRSDLVELVLSHTSGTISIDEPDDDGWTPLLWACRFCEEWGTPKEISPEIVKLLLDRGADPSVRGRTSDDREWSPLKMARFHGASQEVIDLLTASPSKRKEDDWKSKFHVSKKAARTTWYCDLCLFHVYGTVYYCEVCGLSYGLCFKCYRYREEFHPYHDKWEERGPEFVDDDEEEEEEKGAEEEGEPKSSPGIEQVQDDDSEGDWSNDEAEGEGK